MKIWTLLAGLALLPGCTDTGAGDTDDASSSGGGSDTTAPTTGDTGGDEAQVPPTTGGKATMRAWLDAGHYKSWACQPAAHGPLPISPHGMNRICSNDVLSAHGAGEYPVDSAGVKELYDDAGANIVGYAVYRHVKAGMGGDSWYWYEDVPDTSMAPHDAEGIVADGLGDSGPAKDICVGCHMATGLDADHPGHDFVYVQVK